jgi:competence protein ComEC
MNNCTIKFWDVQHGNAIYINTPNNRHIVIDLGTGVYRDSNIHFSPLNYLKTNLGITQLDYVFITHPHLDHIDDILNLNALSPKTLWRPKHLSEEELKKGISSSDMPKIEEYIKFNNRYNVPIESGGLSDLNTIEHWGGAKITVFNTQDCAESNINNHSLIIVLEVHGEKIVFTGDNESCSYNKLFEDKDFENKIANADILLASHHGRESGYHLDFVEQVNPKLTIISDGRFTGTSVTNKYSALTSGLEVYKKGSEKMTRKVLSTRQDGDITVTISSEYLTKVSTEI